MKKLIALFLCLFIFTGCSKKSAEPISSVNDISDKNIAVLVGTAGTTYAEENFPNAKLLHFNSLSDAVIALKAGQADAIISDLSSLNGAISVDNSIALLPEKLVETHFAAAFKKGNTKLLEEFNSFVDTMISNNTYDDIKQRWNVDHDYTLPDIKLSGENGTIKLGVACNTGLPVAGIVDKKIVGNTVEMGLRFADAYGYDIEIIDMEFSSLIPALESGKIDIAVNDITVTEERKKQVDFSTPYDVGSIVVAVLAERMK